MAAEEPAPAELRLERAPPPLAEPRGLQEALGRLSPRGAFRKGPATPPSRVKANKIPTPRQPVAAGGCAAEGPALAAGRSACYHLGEAEDHEDLARALCEAVRAELQELLKSATCALQDAVRSEMKLALSASPGMHHARLPSKPGSSADQEPFSPASPSVPGNTSNSAPLEGRPESSRSRKLTWPVRSFDKTDSVNDERTRNLSKFAEKHIQTAVMESKGPAWLDHVTYFWKLKEPRREGKLATLFKQARFEIAVQLVIMSNCVFMALAANSEVANWNADRHPIILPLEITFQVIYTLELIGKLSVHRLFFFWNEDWALNLLDFMLVVTGAMEIAFRLGNIWNLSYMRSLRVVKVAKALRLIRVITSAEALRNIFICIIGSLMNFVWSIIMLTVVLYMFSLGFVISTGTHLHEMGEDTSEVVEAQRTDLLSMYGSVQQSMLTLYKATTGGDDWSLSYNVISFTGWIPSLLYLLFVAFMQIALVNIITGIFVDTALQQLAPDREAIALSHHREKELMAEEMRAHWREVAEEDDGYLTLADFHKGLRGTKIPYQLEDLGLSVENVTQFFGVLQRKSPEDGKVRISNFVHGCMRLKGVASSYDIQEIRSEVLAIGRKVDHVWASLGE